MKHVPNLITIARLFLIPLFIYAFFSDSPYAQVYALAIYLIAGITDLLDGYLARKYNVISVVGIVLDPLADKLMLLTALWCLFTVHEIPTIFFTIVVIIEIVQIVSGIYLYFNPRKEVIPANKFGKSATVLFAVAVSMLILLPNSLPAMGILLLAVSSKVISFTSYLLHFLRIRKQSKEA